MGADNYPSSETAWPACRDADPELFFPIPEDTMGHPTPEAEWALAVCRTCKVVDACLEYAMDHNERLGIWGGMTSGQRSALAAKMGRRLLSGVR